MIQGVGDATAQQEVQRVVKDVHQNLAQDVGVLSFAVDQLRISGEEIENVTKGQNVDVEQWVKANKRPAEENTVLQHTNPALAAHVDLLL